MCIQHINLPSQAGKNKTKHTHTPRRVSLSPPNLCAHMKQTYKNVHLYMCSESLNKTTFLELHKDLSLIVL